MNSEKPKLEDLKNNIKKEIPFVDVKPFSHNIISMTLSMIEENYVEYLNWSFTFYATTLDSRTL